MRWIGGSARGVVAKVPIETRRRTSRQIDERDRQRNWSIGRARAEIGGHG